MNFRIPREWDQFAGLQFEAVIPIELNDLDIDRMLCHLFEMFIRHGRTARSFTDKEAFDEYFSDLVANPLITGLSTDRKELVLKGWLLASIVRMGKKGLRRETPQMDHLRPITAAVIRSGLPKSRRNRRADTLIYRSVRAEVERRGSATPEAEIRERTKLALGEGIRFGNSVHDHPQYDPDSQIDINARLTLLFMEGMPEPKRGLDKEPGLESTLPGAISPIGVDVFNIISCFGPTLPANEIASYLMALTSLRLFQLPLRYALAFRDLRNTATLNDDCIKPDSANQLEMYCDFTRERNSESEALAKACVQRDLEIMGRFFADRMFLRLLYGLQDQLIPLKDELESLKDRPMERLLFLVERLDTEALNLALESRIERLKELMTNEPGNEDGLELLSAFQRIGASPEEQITRLLVEGLRKRGLENQVKWFWSTGGIAKPYGLLRGTLKARRTWRYEPSDPLLLAMLLTCFVDEKTNMPINQLPMRDLLQRLSTKFGVLVDRPPQDLDSPTARAAASRNLQAFLRQLQLLGCFDGLSDDFSAQIVRRPRRAVDA